KYPEGKAAISVFDYDEHHFLEKQIDQPTELLGYRDKPTTTWINIDGIHDVKLVELVCSHYKIHPLTIEDILHPEQRPKLEDSDDYLFVVLKMLNFEEKTGFVHSEQVGLILGENFVISFQEVLGDT